MKRQTASSRTGSKRLPGASRRSRWMIPSSVATRKRSVGDVRAFCRDQISHYKVPRYIRMVSGFPTTVTGKVQKFQMRERMIEELGRSPR